MDWIDLVQVRDGWRAVMNDVPNFQGSIKCGESLE